MVYQDPNVPYQDPNMVFPDPNLAYPDPNMIYPDPNMIYPDPNMVYPDPNMVNPPVDQPVGPPNDLFQPEPYPYQDLGMAQQQPPPSGWYIPPGAVPNGFELDDTPIINEGSLNDPGEYIDNDFEGKGWTFCRIVYLSKTKVKGTGFFPHTSNFLFIPSIESQQKINEVSIVKKSLFLEILPS